MMFPVEAVPDGAVLAAHHAIYGLLAALVIIATVWDDYRDREPLAEFAGVLAGLFAFIFVWRYQPSIGATPAHVGPLLALAWMWRPGSA
jgi:membrane associated rhomboid family serine protease